MATKSEQTGFVRRIYPAARELRDAGDGIHPSFVTAQAALETGWRERGLSNNIFGITKGSSWKGATQLCLTVEYFAVPDRVFALPEEVESVERVSAGRYKYRVYRLFRVYPSIAECLGDHLAILRGAAYADAWPYRDDPFEYARRIVDDSGARYATAPDYGEVMRKMIMAVENIIKTEGL
jgi:flagellar protein FlgJ